MRICIDLDQTLCSGKPYAHAVPYDGASDFLRDLRASGHTVILYTARGMGRNSGDAGRALKDVGLVTLRQLESWGFEYDEIYFGKPAADLYIDDKALPVVSYEKLKNQIEQADLITKRFSRPDSKCNVLCQELKELNDA